MSTETKNNIVDDEEKKSLLKELKEMLDKLFRSIAEHLKEIMEKHSGTKMPSVFEAMKQCEEAISDLENSQEINTEVVKSLIRMTSDLSNKIGNMSEEEIHSEVEKLRQMFSELKADVEKTEIKIKTEDLKKALKNAFCKDTLSIKDFENSEQQVLLSSDNEIFVRVKDKENEYYARVSLMNSSDDRNVKNEVYIRTVFVPEKKISMLVPVEQNENDNLEDVLLRTVCRVNDLQYEKYVKENTEEIEQKKVEIARIEQRLRGGEKKTLYTEILKILKDRNNCSIDSMSNGNINISFSGQKGSYWININNNGNVKNYTYQPPKDSNGNRVKAVEIMTGSGKIINQELAGSNYFRELMTVVRTAQREIAKSEKAHTNPEKNTSQSEMPDNKQKNEVDR